jgi:hypothetical protein
MHQASDSLGARAILVRTTKGGTGLVYCPYTDRDLSVDETSPEHVIPLSLGGVDEITIPVCGRFNSTIGSKVDGALANDFLVMTKRDRYCVKGHSGREPVFVVKNSADAGTGEPLQVSLGQREGLRIWSPLEGRFRTESGPSSVSIKINLDVDVALRFVAKVALSAGYFVYGDLFRNKVKHREFRAIMNNRPPDLGEAIYEMEALVDDRFSTNKSEQLQVLRAMCCAAEPYSLIGLVPGPNRLAAFVGVLGDYMGMISVPADTSDFPNQDMFHWGHVIVFEREGSTRISFRNALERMVGLV